MIQDSSSITNKEALRDKIHEIHNYLRNNGAGYGMNALKVFNLLYGLKKIEESNLLDKVNLKRPECEFSYLLKIANENKDEELTDLIIKKVLDSIYSSKIKNLLFYEIPKNIKASVFSHLIKEINKITDIEKTCNVLLSGKIYEYFIGRDESAISELGAYFTDRHIVEYILSKLNPTINENGNIETMIDMFGGSGGFTTGYINYLKNKYPDKINWDTEINKIYHYDMNEDVIKSAGLEFFCLTGSLPNTDNLVYKNSFNDEFNNKKFKYPLTNPPYGGDNNKKSDTKNKHDKIKEYIKNELKTITADGIRIKRQKQLKNIEALKKMEKETGDKMKVCLKTSSKRICKFAVANKLDGNDKESVSLMLLMDIVEEGGTAIGVLKEGVFFNPKYKKLRQCLIKNYNVREIISVPQDQFENTTTKTSIVIFDNTKEKTTKVKFSELSVEKIQEDKFQEIDGNIFLVENKGDFLKVVETFISEASIDDILENKICSLNGKDYNKKEIIVGEGYELVKLGDICDFLQKSKRNASFGEEKGKYNFYTSSDKIQKCDIADYDEEALLIGTGGNSCIHYVKNEFSCSADIILLKSEKINKYYIYYSLLILWDMFTGNMRGSVIKHVTKEMTKNFSIPIPKSQEKIKEWVDKISKPYNEKNDKKIKIDELEKKVQEKIKNIIDEEECNEVELGSICEIKSGKNLTKEKAISGIYNVYGGGESSYTHNEYNFDGFNIIISRVGNNKTLLINEKIYLTDNGFSLIIKDKIKKYIGYYLYNNTDLITKLSNGSAQKVITKTQLNKLIIKIPKNKKLIEDLDPIFNKIEKIQIEVQEADILYKKYITELSEEAIPNNKNIIQIENDNNSEISENVSNEEIIEDIIEEVKEKVKMKKVIKKVKKQVIQE
jgi:type I restriction-modification system DNA methylase subunit